MSEMSRDTAGVIVPPPLIPHSVLLVGLALNFLVTMRLLGHISPDRETPLVTINFVVGVAMVIGCQLRLPTHRHPLPPSQPTLAFATAGRFGERYR